MPRPSRPTIFALVVGVLSYGGRVWDALDHSHALETWLKHGSLGVFGELVSQLIANGWLFVFLGLILWWHDSVSGARGGVKQTPAGHEDEVNKLKRTITTQIDEVYQANSARDEARAERDACKNELQNVAAQRDHVQGELRDLLRNIDDTTVSKITAQALVRERDAYRDQLRGLTPLVILHRTVAALAARLQSFRDNMEEVKITGNLDWESSEIARISDENAAAFSRDFRPDLVRLSTSAKQRYGLVHASLTDDALTREVYGSLGVDPYLQGLRELMDRIRDMIADEALEIDAK